MIEPTTGWAFTLLRPLLKQLKVQELKKEPITVRASKHTNFIIAGLARWIIIARQFSFHEGSKGFAEVIFSEKYNIPN